MTASATRTTRARAAALLPFLVLASGIHAADGNVKQKNPPKIEIDLRSCEQGLRAQLPADVSGPVEREGEATTAGCAALALGTARQALGDPSTAKARGDGSALASSFLERVSDFPLGSAATLKLIESALESGGTFAGFAERLEQAVLEKGPGVGIMEAAANARAEELARFLLKEGAEKAWYALAPNGSVVMQEDRFRVGACDGRYVVTVSASLTQARGEVRIDAEGDCHCSDVKGGVRLGRFSVLGVAPLTFGNLTKKGTDTWTLSYSMGRPQYRVAAPCCEMKGGTWTTPAVGTPVPAPGDPTRTAAQQKKYADVRRIEEQCDPDGTLQKLLAWEERELERQRERHEDVKAIAWRKSEFARLQIALCGCLDAMHSDRSLRSDRGLVAQVGEIRERYCTPLADEVQTPAPTRTPHEVGTPAETLAQPLTPTSTPSSTPSSTPTPTLTPREVRTPTSTPTRTHTPTPTQTPTPTPSRTPRDVRTPTSTPTQTHTPSPSRTPRDVRTPTSTPTSTHTPTPTRTPRDVRTPPQTPGTVGTEAVRVGVVFSTDTRRGERTTGIVVTDPQRYENRPDVIVLKVAVHLPKGLDGKPGLAGTTVSVGGGPAQPADRPLTCDVPRVGRVLVTVQPPSGLAIQAGEVPVNETPRTLVPAGISAPPAFAAGDSARIAWRFDGDSSNTSVRVGSQSARVIAETPRGCVAEIPADVPPGPVEMLVTERARTRRLRTNVIRLRISADQPELRRGQSTKFHVVVEGLNDVPDLAWNSGPDQSFVDRALLDRISPGTRIPGPTEPGYFLLTIQSASPETTALAKSTGDLIRLVITKRDVSPKGTFAYHGVARSLGDGRLEVKATVFALVGPAAGEWVP